MKSTVLSILLTVALVGTTEANNLVLLDFDTSEYDSTLARLALLEERGVTARHIIAPHYVIADIHQVPLGVIISGGGKGLHG